MQYLVWIEDNGRVVEVRGKVSKLAAVREYNRLGREFAAAGKWPAVYGWSKTSEAPVSVRAQLA